MKAVTSRELFSIRSCTKQKNNSLKYYCRFARSVHQNVRKKVTLNLVYVNVMTDFRVRIAAVLLQMTIIVIVVKKLVLLFAPVEALVSVISATVIHLRPK